MTSRSFNVRYIHSFAQLGATHNKLFISSPSLWGLTQWWKVIILQPRTNERREVSVTIIIIFGLLIGAISARYKNHSVVSQGRKCREENLCISGKISNRIRSVINMFSKNARFATFHMTKIIFFVDFVELWFRRWSFLKLNYNNIKNEVY
jgi:hypothetical protein